LDYLSEGLLIITNDGDLASALELSTLSRYREAQEILDEHKKDIEKYFKDMLHPAHFSIINNQALLYKVSPLKINL
jgi:hypothetical protein